LCGNTPTYTPQERHFQPGKGLWAFPKMGMLFPILREAMAPCEELGASGHVVAGHDICNIQLLRNATMSQSSTPAIAAGIADVTFRLLGACQEKERRAAKKLGLAVSEFRVLRMFRGKSPLRVKDLLELLDEDTSRLSRILGSLEKSGYIVRSIQPDDRREINVTLTAKGSELTGKLERQYVRIHEEILKDIPVNVHKPLLHGLENLLVAIERWLREK
jgi:DNA-binding MarR family transcriptional regulator